jgi:hypothetical protein
MHAPGLAEEPHDALKIGLREPHDLPPPERYDECHMEAMAAGSTLVSTPPRLRSALAEGGEGGGYAEATCSCSCGAGAGACLERAASADLSYSPEALPVTLHCGARPSR